MKRPNNKKSSSIWWCRILCVIALLLLTITPAIQSKIIKLFGVVSIVPVFIVLLLLILNTRVWRKPIEGMLLFLQWLGGLIFILMYSATAGLYCLDFDGSKINNSIIYGSGIIGEWWLRVINPITQIYDQHGNLDILENTYPYMIDSTTIGNLTAVTCLVGFVFLVVFIVTWSRR